ncbi:MAG: hypothetical protein ABWJ98_01760 [Hydrogenothermaceae bacterium]
MKLKEKLEVEFKEVSYICRCGSINKIVVLVINGYGFEDSYCENCRKRNKVEVDENFIYTKSI